MGGGGEESISNALRLLSPILPSFEKCRKRKMVAEIAVEYAASRKTRFCFGSISCHFVPLRFVLFRSVAFCFLLVTFILFTCV